MLDFMLLNVILGAVAYKKRWLTVDGLIMSMVLGTILYVLGGWFYYLSTLSFLIISSIATNYKKRRKIEQHLAQGGDGVRDSKNVLGSGLVPMVLAIFNFLLSSLSFYWMWLLIGALTTATADTLGSEIGVLSKKRPILITSLTRHIPRGSPGGVSKEGLYAEVIGAFTVSTIMAILCLIFGVMDCSVVMIVIGGTLLGFLGANIDSLIGAYGYIKGKRIKGVTTNFFSTVLGAVFSLFIISGYILVIMSIIATWFVIASSN